MEPEYLEVAFSYRDLLRKCSRRVAEISEEWYQREQEEFKNRYDLEPRYVMAWKVRQKIRTHLLSKETVPQTERIQPDKPYAYSLFLSRQIDCANAAEIIEKVESVCNDLCIKVRCSGGEMQPATDPSPFRDVRDKIRASETLLAVLSRRENENDQSNIWLVSEVAMALALGMPVSIITIDGANEENWRKLGEGYQEFKCDWEELDECLFRAITNADTRLQTKISRQF